MLISELIARLQEILDREGDEDAYIGDGCEETEVVEVRHLDGDSGEDYWYPDRVVIR